MSGERGGGKMVGGGRGEKAGEERKCKEAKVKERRVCRRSHEWGRAGSSDCGIRVAIEECGVSKSNLVDM